MRIKQLKLDSWYRYQMQPLALPIFLNLLLTFNDNHKVWRFICINGYLYDLTREEVHACIKPVHPTLDQYFSLFIVEE